MIVDPAIEAVLKRVGTLYGNQRDYLACANGHEQSRQENRKTCALCGGEIYAHLPQSEILVLRWRIWKQEWLPYRTSTFEGWDDEAEEIKFGPWTWHAPRKLHKLIGTGRLTESGGDR